MMAERKKKNLIGCTIGYMSSSIFVLGKMDITCTILHFKISLVQTKQ